MLDEIVGDAGDPVLAHAMQPRKGAPNEPERRLMVDVLTSALKDASRTFDCQVRRDARAWLRDAAALFSARVCCEAAGIDYGAALKVLEQRWREADGASALKKVAP